MSDMLQEYYDFLQTYSHPGPDLMQHISTLPTPLTIEMTRELYSPTLAKIPLFNGVQPAFLESLARGLILCVFLAGVACQASAADGNIMLTLLENRLIIDWVYRREPPGISGADVAW